MADPITLAIIGIAVSAGGQILSGIQQYKAASYSAKVYEQEAKTQKQAAAYEEKKHRESVQRFIGIQRSRYGASGIDISAGGSAQTIINDTAAQGELDALAIRYGGDIAAIQAKNRASMSRFEGKSALTSGLFGAGSTLLSGASSIYEQKQRLKLKGK